MAFGTERFAASIALAVLDMLQAQVHTFQQLAIGGDQVGDQPHHEQQAAYDQAYRSEDQRLDVAAAITQRVMNEKAHAGGYADRPQHSTAPQEEAEWTVDHEYPQDGDQ